ncbi:DNA primase [Liquorilactobacillus sucicola DSM 21376 = JCM 15457]|uniref:DNA primase n=1 Tax=Liquorilactobacillus sucicola DSM 21376 = JCM 15457 TaxID=1423806 RepID=A0A023CVC4_9LACO|nr:DNA primase [Liquorilactobacillus sucicola]KRN05420.1 DNA primase [Liquorilactobacillus sucicola DSM 21376 = JCM 15457]GAJ25495.1 DNA primase [Liquorilactobacillus sucicola DSM 21376 = JCM 15457]
MSRRIPEEVIETVRSSVNIVEIVGQYVQLRKSGKNYFGLCPFHEEKTPSFSVTEEKQIFHCFSCHRGGNVFKFIMEIENLSFPDAVVRVAELGNVKLSKEITDNLSNDNVSESSETTRMKTMYNDAAHLFNHILVNTAMGEKALTYLHERGLDDAMIQEFNLGFAPAKELLEAFFKEKGLEHQLLRKSGLFVELQDGSLKERFQNRVLFPIRDPRGETIAFSGRLLIKDDKQPKYLNSPETLIFNKRKVLFNFDKAKSKIRQQKSAILFEGFMDVLAAYRAGVENGVASMGTSLTNEQVYLLERITDHLDICYDGDDPGQHATARAINLLEPLTKMELGVLHIPEKMDPDEYVKKYGSEKFHELAHSSRETTIAFYMRYYEQDRNLANEADQLAYLADVLQRLAKIKSPVERDIYLNQLGKRFGIEKSNLEAQLQTYATKDSRNREFAKQEDRQPGVLRKDRIVKARNEQRHLDRVEKAERLLLYRLLHDHNVWLKVREISNFSFVHDPYQTIYLIAEGYFNVYSEYDTARFLDYLEDESLRQLLIELAMSVYAEDTSEEEVDDCVDLIMKQSPLEDKIRDTKKQLSDAKRMNNNDLVTSLTIKLVNLLRQQQIEKSTSL